MAASADFRLKQCGRCQLAHYCSKACSKAAWKAGHKVACRAPGQFEVGDKVFVQAMGPDGESGWYQAVVLGIRKRFPPLKVMYIKTHPGRETGPLVLPSPVTAHVPATAVRKDAPA